VSESYTDPSEHLIEQAAVLRDLELPEVFATEGEEAAVRIATYPWAVVLNQACDLQFDRLARAGESLREGGKPVPRDKQLRSILLCPAFPLENVLAGTYIAGATAWIGTRKNILCGNRDDRYHVLPEDPRLGVKLALDFKLIVATAPELLRAWAQANRGVVAVLRPPYRDRLMQRFVGYFGRIALPEED
jgi:hypothetical protein